MPRYRVLEKSVIGNTVFEEGAEVDYDGLPSHNLEALDDEGRAKAEESKAVQKASIEQMIRDSQPLNGMDPKSFAEAMGKVLIEQRAPAESLV